MDSLPAELVASLPTKKRSRTGKNEYGLTDNQECFCRLITENDDMSLIDAYLLAYPNFTGKRVTAQAAASRVWRLPYIQERVEVLRDAYVMRCPISKGEALTLLAKTARKAADDNDANSLATCIREIRSMVPGWDKADEDAKDEARSIEITVITEGRTRPVREITTIDVPAQIGSVDYAE